MSVYARLWRRTGTTILMVTHDIAEAVFLAQRIYVLTGRPGRVRAEVVVDPAGLLGAESAAALRERVSGLLREPEPAAEPAGGPGRAAPAASAEGRLACT